MGSFRPVLIAMFAALGLLVPTATAGAALTQAASWQASTAYVIDDIRQPTTPNDHYYKCTVAGTSGATEPTWPTTPGGTVVDGTVTWQEDGAPTNWITRTSSPGTTGLAVDLTGYLYLYGNDGLEPLSVTIGLEYRKVGDPTWLDFYGTGEVTLTSSSRKPLRWSHKINVAEEQYEVRVRRVTPDETDNKATSNINWTQLKSYQPDTADYTGQKRLAMKIKASAELQGQVDAFNAMASATVPTWTGAAWVDAESSNPAWLFLYLARGKQIGFCGLLSLQYQPSCHWANETNNPGDVFKGWLVFDYWSCRISEDWVLHRF